MSTHKTPQEIELLSQQPGLTGVLWRLVKACPPDAIGPWLAEEAKLGTLPHDTATAIGNFLAGIAFGYATQMSNPVDVLDSVMLVMNSALQKKLERAKQGGIFVPTEAEVAKVMS